MKQIEEAWPHTSASKSNVTQLCGELRASIAATFNGGAAVAGAVLDTDDAVHVKDKAARLWCAHRRARAKNKKIDFCFFFEFEFCSQEHGCGWQSSCNGAKFLICF